MIIVRLKGGLGNQLFQYATGYSIAKKNGFELGVDVSGFVKGNIRNYRLDCLNFPNINIVDSNKLPLGIRIIKNKYINKILRIRKTQLVKIDKLTSYLFETSYPVLIGNICSENTENIYLDGYFQSPLYFQEYRNELLHAILPCFEYSDYVKKLFYDIYKTNSVAVHIRRGDFLRTKNRSGYHYILDDDYYIRTIDYMRQKINNPLFYFFSDDIQWVKEKWGNNENIRIISIKEQNSDIIELMLMKECKHIITANSSFSWWAAWLKENDEAICIVPRRQYGNDKMIPMNWMKM